MLTAHIVTLCCCAVLFCPALGYSQHLCDIESWVADNDMPINKLDLSTQSKAKLVQSIRSEGKLIKCSVLRLIHKEAELDRPFRQSRYKVSSKRAKEGLARRDDDRRSDHDREPFLDERDDRGYSRGGGEETGEEHDRRRAKSDDTADSEASSHSTGSRSQDQTDHQTANQQLGTDSDKQSKEEIGLPDEAALHQEQQQKDASGAPVAETSPSNRTADGPAVDTDKPDVGLDTRLQQGFNETSNSSGFQPITSGTNDTAANVTTSGNRTRNSLVDWLHPCYTCPLALNRTQSWWLCRILLARDAKAKETQPEPEPVHVSSPLPVLCQKCGLDSRNKSIHLCEVFFPTLLPKIMNASRPIDNSSSVGNTTEAAPATNRNTVRPLNTTNTFMLTCLQCPMVSPDHHKQWTSNSTRSMCVFATATYRQAGDGQTLQGSNNQQQQNLLADKLQFIDEETTVSVVADSPTDGRELMGDTEQSTRARHEIHSQKEQKQEEDAKDAAARSVSQKHDSQSSDEAPGPQPKPAVAAAANDTAAEILAKQVDVLSHSAFMEKLFEALSRRQKTNSTVPMGNSSTSKLIDSLNSKVDHLANMTDQKSNRSELSKLEIRLQEAEARLEKKLVQMERKNRRLVDQIRKLEALNLTAMKLTACQRQLNQTNSSLQSLARRHGAQLAMVTRRLAQMSQRVESTEHKWNRTQLLLQPAMPLLSPDSGGGGNLRVRDSHESQPLHAAASAALPNVNGKSVIDDCSDIYARMPNRATIDDGIFLANVGLSAPVKVRCDLKNSGWTYILSRSDGAVDFFRNWTSYRAGFGNPPGEHFIGLDALAEMTSRRRYQLQVVLEDWEGSVKHVQYGQFHVLGERHNFQLRVNHFEGDPTVGDALSSHSNASFSTFDADNDLVQSKFGGNCAKRFRGGFWYFSCYRANPTGRYYSDGGKIPDKKCDGIVWKTWKGPHYSLRSIHMKVRPTAL